MASFSLTCQVKIHVRHKFTIMSKARQKRKTEEKKKNTRVSERLLHPTIFSIILQSDPVHVFQSILLNQPRLKFIFIYFCTYFLDLSRFERQSGKKIASLFHFLAANTCTHRGPIFQQRAKRPRIVDVLGHWELS